MSLTVWKRNVRPIEIVGADALVPLTRGKVAVIDAADAGFVGQWNWHAEPKKCGLWYARRELLRDEGGPGKIYLHQMLLPVSAGSHVDHRDSDGLNCRRGNLREATPRQNQGNRRGGANGLPKGVYRCHHRFYSSVAGRYLGSFATQEEAAAAYARAAEAHFGEFARTA